jgi:hypothetical protein
MQNLKLQFKIKKLLLSVIIFCFLFFVFGFINAATIYFESSQNNYSKGDTFIENVILDTENEQINTVEVNIVYPADLLEVKEISTGGSVLKLWASSPEIKKSGLIYFAGGVPGGYKGKDGKLVSIIFHVLKAGESKISFDKVRILLNDGKGSEAKIKTREALINTSRKSGSPQDQWAKLLKNDKNPPQPFKIKLGKDPTMFGDKYFISFATIDKETGIDHYEVLETPLNAKSISDQSWTVTESPYVLKDQSLQSEIMVKAIDRAGNERIERFNPKSRKNNLVIIITILILIAIITFFLFFVRKNKKKKKEGTTSF